MRFSAVAWCDAAANGLANAMKYADDAAAIEAEVRAGRAELWKCDDGVSWLITRVEFGCELVIVCYEGKNARQMFKRFYEHATQMGFRSIRFHTQQPWLIELFRDFDPEPVEYVMRVFLGEHRKTKFYAQKGAGVEHGRQEQNQHRS
jgi:hypothetical protein